jgi:L-fuconolactonase
VTPDSVAGTGTNPSAVIDAHVHLWDLAVHPQPWTEPFPALRRSFLLPDLRDVLTAGGIDAAIVVQAGDSSGETLDLLALAGVEPALAGVVGWIDFTAGDVADQTAALRSAPGGDHLVGVRHQLQVEPDRQWLARDQVRKGLSRLAALGLCFDIVVSANQLPLVVDAVTALPDTRFVLDHAGKPPIATGDLAAWRSDLARLAARPNVAVKLSGLVTEADWEHWRQDQLEPVITHTLESFGPSRVMAGSDWPVCLLAADYPTVRSTLAPALARLSSSERDDVLGDTARRWYQRPA